MMPPALQPPIGLYDLAVDADLRTAEKARAVAGTEVDCSGIEKIHAPPIVGAPPAADMGADLESSPIVGDRRPRLVDRCLGRDIRSVRGAPASSGRMALAARTIFFMVAPFQRFAM